MLRTSPSHDSQVDPLSPILWIPGPRDTPPPGYDRPLMSNRSTSNGSLFSRPSTPSSPSPPPIELLNITEVSKPSRELDRMTDSDFVPRHSVSSTLFSNDSFRRSISASPRESFLLDSEDLTQFKRRKFNSADNNDRDGVFSTTPPVFEGSSTSFHRRSSAPQLHTSGSYSSNSPSPVFSSNHSQSSVLETDSSDDELLEYRDDELLEYRDRTTAGNREVQLFSSADDDGKHRLWKGRRPASVPTDPSSWYDMYQRFGEHLDSPRSSLSSDASFVDPIDWWYGDNAIAVSREAQRSQIFNVSELEVKVPLSNYYSRSYGSNQEDESNLLNGADESPLLKIPNAPTSSATPRADDSWGPGSEVSQEHKSNDMLNMAARSLFPRNRMTYV